MNASKVSLGHAVASVFIGLAFVAVLLWFERGRFYHDHFFEPGLSVTLYQSARIAFTGFLGWLIYATGAGVAALIGTRDVVGALPAWERFPLLFIAGAGVLHLTLFALGLAGFYTKSIALVVVLGIMAASVPHLAACLKRTTEGFHRLLHAPRKGRTIPIIILIMAVSAAALTFMLVKGLYPAGGHDYFTHYFHYYNKVIQNGSILPNEVWYHFYYSKGAGLYFLSMLLTDPLAPQLVTTTYIACGAAIVWALLRRAGTNSLVPWIGVLLYLALLIYTPGPEANRRHGGWGDLEKIHELTAVLCLAIVWIAYRLAHDQGKAIRIWGVALQLAIVNLALLTPALVIMMGGFLFVYFVYLFGRKRRAAALWVFSGCVTAGISLLSIGGINYYLTGIPLDQLILQFWRYVDLQKVYDWGVLLEILMLHAGHTGFQAQSSSWSWALLPLLATYLRLELWWPIMLAALPLLAFQLGTASGRQGLLQRTDAHLWVALFAFAGMVLLVALFGGGRSQDISFYRLSSFSYAPMLCAALCLWYLALGMREFRKRWPEARVAVLLAIAIPVWVGCSTIPLITARGHSEYFATVLSNARRLMAGTFSLKEAYQNQQGWSGRYVYGAIYPGVVMPWRMLPPKTPIWSFHVASYCMLPDCEMRTFPSYRFSPSWQTVFFGPIEEAKRKLREERLNFFFYSSELGMNDAVPAAPFLTPERISDHLGIKWTDGTSYLLTWKDSTTQPLTPEFLASYRKSVSESPSTGSFLSGNWRAISDYIALHAGSLKPFALPWCTNCQNMRGMDLIGAQ